MATFTTSRSRGFAESVTYYLLMTTVDEAFEELRVLHETVWTRCALERVSHPTFSDEEKHRLRIILRYINDTIDVQPPDGVSPYIVPSEYSKYMEIIEYMRTSGKLPGDHLADMRKLEAEPCDVDDL